MTTLTLDKETRAGIQVLHARGRLTLGDGAAALRETVDALLAGGGPMAIVLDLGDVGYVDSAGIGVLVSAYTSTTSQGGRFVLAGLQKRVLDLLQITKLYTVFKVYDSVDEAVAAEGKPAPA